MLTCNPGVSALHNFNISWLFIPAGSSVTIRTIPTTSPDYSLILDNVNQSSSGVYQCQVNAKMSLFLPSNPLACQQGVAINLTVEQYGMSYEIPSLIICHTGVLSCRATIECFLITHEVKPCLVRSFTLMLP